MTPQTYFNFNKNISVFLLRLNFNLNNIEMPDEIMEVHRGA